MEWVELEQLSELQRLGSVLPCEMCHIATAVLLACYHTCPCQVRKTSVMVDSISQNTQSCKLANVPNTNSCG